MKKRLPPSKLVFLLSSLCLMAFISFQSCYNNKEGCLDIKASNFDFDADRDCCQEEECCCTYPSLNLNVLHKQFADSTENFELGELYPWPIGDGLFSITSFRLYLSNISIENEVTNENLNIRDSIDIQVLESDGSILTKKFEDNFNLINPEKFTYEIGEIQGSGSYNAVNMVLGIETPVKNGNPSSVPEGHDLSLQSPPMQNSIKEGYFTCNITLKKDTFVGTSVDTIRLFDVENLKLTFQDQMEISNGKDVSVEIRVNYLDLFQGIDFAVDNSSQVKTKIESNLPVSISLID